MPGPKQHHFWRWASLATVIIFLVLSLIILGSHAAAAQGPSSPASLEQDEYDLRVGKWKMWDWAPVQPGGVAVYGIWYGNMDAPAAAHGVTIADSLPAGTFYVGDTSGLPHSVNAGVITWDVGTLEPGENALFMVTLGIPIETIAPGVLDPNLVAIAPILNDLDLGNNDDASEPVEVIPLVPIDVGVEKGPQPGDPTPGQEFQYLIGWCNNSEVAVGPVTLIDTLPAGVHYVRWEANPEWQKYWNLDSANDSAVTLVAPGLPAETCEEVIVVLEVDPAVEISTTLTNTVEIHVADDSSPENDVHINTEAHVSPPRADLDVEKLFNGGVLVPGGAFEYQISFWNQGNVAADTFMTDTLPVGLTYQVGSTRLNGEPFPDPTPDGQELVWALGTVAVNGGGDLSFVVDIDPGAPFEEFGNCVEISHDQDEDTPQDNESCVYVRLWPPGPNLHVEKQSQWNYDHIQYRFFAANIGTVPIPNVVVVDTYPVGTAPEGEPNVPPHLQERTTVTLDPGQWRVEITELLPGESGWFDFNVSIVDPEVRPAQFVNEIEITGDLPEPDVNPADNFYEDWIVKGEVDRVELSLEPDGQSSMWGEAVPGQPVRVTTPAGEFETTAGLDECPFCWEIQDTGIVNEGDVITVESAAGVMPVVFQVPDPFTAELDRAAGTVSGEIGGWEEQPVEVRGWWDAAWQQLMTNGAGEYEAVYADPIPPGAEGVTYFETMANYAQVTYRRHFRDMSLLLQVNYDHDWIQGEYEIGHNVWLTVTKPGQVYTATLTTEYIPDWDKGGFHSDWGEWSPEHPNLEHGDLVSGTVDTGYTAVLTIGQITGWVDVDNDRIDGEVHAGWLPDPEVDVECQPWGAPEGVPSKWDVAGITGVPPYHCDWGGEWDVRAGQDIAVAYYEPEGHQVYGVFSAPWMRVNYGHDWVGGNYALGHTFVVTVTDSGGAVKGIAEDVEVTPDGGWGGSGFETHEDNWIGGSPPDIVPGDYAYFYTEGYSHTVRVGDIGGAVDVLNDRVGGPIHAGWLGDILLDVECHPWGAPEGVEAKDSTAGSLGAPEYDCDWGGEWDIVAHQDIGVMYIEPDDGDRVINVFWESAPDMSVGKGSVGGDQFAPGGRAVFWIEYNNEGDADAYPAILVDTLPADATYVEDTSGLAANYDEGAGTVTWDLGTVAPGEGGAFYLVVELPDPAPEDLTNVVEIFADADPNQENDYAEATIHRTEPYVELHVWKNPSPGDPTPGSTYVYDIEYGNNGTVPSGQATLTDILPDDPGVCSTSVVDWYSENGYDLWSDISADNTELVLTAPSLPAGWGDRIILRLKVDDACPTEIQLVNEVILSAPPADTVSHVHEDAWTSGPYTNAHLDKDFGWGILVPGGEIGYNLHVSNHGNLTATVSLTDTLPIGTSFVESWSWDGQEHLPLVPSHLDDDSVSWSLGEIPPGAWLDIELRLDIAPTVAPNEVLTNCAEIVVAEGDVEPLDNTACQTEAVRGEGPNLRIYKDYRWNSEGQIQYDIQFQNVGTEPLLGVEIVDTLPEGTDFSDEWGHDFWDELYYDPLGLTPRWIIPVLEPGWSSRIWFNANLDSGEQGMTYTNVAAAEIEGDVWPEDNISEVTAYTGPDIFVEKWLSGGEVRPGEIVTFTVKFGNQNRWPWGTDPEPPDPPTAIADTLPDELTFVTATAPWNPDEVWAPDEIAGNTLTWGFGPMDPESWWTFQIVALVAEDAVADDVIVNTVEAVSNSEHDEDPLPGNNIYELYLIVLPDNYPIYLPLVLRNH